MTSRQPPGGEAALAERAVDSYDEFGSVMGAAKVLGVFDSRLCGYLDRFGVVRESGPRRRRPRKPKDFAPKTDAGRQAVERRLAGDAIATAGADLGVSENAVRTRLRRASKRTSPA